MSMRSSSAVSARSILCKVVWRPYNRAYSISSHIEASSLSTTPPSSTNKVIFSGIQPTGVPHLGNYLGAIQQWVKLQNESPPTTSLIFSVVDLHAITVPQNPLALRKSKRETLATLLAVGLDPARCTIFFQSDVPAHSELMWILSCSASMGYLSRMTQWKSKLDLDDNANPMDSSTKAKLKLGLFSYPVLQAADILVHGATHVPVGHDQSQHLEFARECAAGFNHLVGDKVLVQPETLLSPAKRVMALDHPNQKMSKSAANPKSRILLTDSSSTIGKKLRVALTDSIEGVTYDPDTRPGVANLIELAFHLDSNHTAKSAAEYAERYSSSTSLKMLKSEVAEIVDAHLEPMRERYEEIMSGNGKVLEDAAQQGAEKARKSAEATMKKVREAVGF